MACFARSASTRSRCRATRPLYRRIVTLLEGGIARGAVPAGLQLPPERDLAAALKVSRATVVSAYRELEARGLVRGYVGRGTFVSATPDAASAPFAWRGKIAASALQATTRRRCAIWCAPPPIRSLISVAAGVPALDCFPTEAFQRAMNHVLATQADAAWRHGPTEGLQPFRAALAHRFGGEPEHILVLAGAQQGLDLLARCLIDPGDAVIIDRPGYLGAIQTFRNAGARLVGWDITRADIDELEELLLRYRPKLIYTNPTHQNPTGVTLPIRTRREMLELAARYRVPIVEDDTYRDLALTGPPPPPSLFALDEAHTVVIRINSFSKMLAPGLRLGWISAVRPIVDQLALIKQQVDPHTQNLSQLVICELVEQGVLDRHLVDAQGRTSAAARRDGAGAAAARAGGAAAVRRAGRRHVSVVRAAAGDPRARGAGPRAAGVGDGPDRRSVLRRPGRRPSAAHLLHVAAGEPRGADREDARAQPRRRRARGRATRRRAVRMV